MPARKQPTLDRNHRRALQHLARVPEGTTEMVMLVHGFPGELLVELVTAGLATVTVQDDGERSVNTTWLRITAAGRKALG